MRVHCIVFLKIWSLLHGAFLDRKFVMQFRGSKSLGTLILIAVLRENRAGCGHRCFRIRPKDFCDYIDPSDIL
jgi:hypothetical protein